ncbi:MAG: hypothetical protein Q4F72_03270 [Desulfovibrionaceae bacterium]|nr:hypothetical protein [Desulfovibrionaceae bacterium]
MKLENAQARHGMERTEPAPPTPADAPPLLFEKPRRQSGCLLWVLVLVLLAGIGGTVSWQFMDAQERQNISDRVNSLLGGTPLEFIRGWLMPRLETRPPLPPINESGDHGVIPQTGGEPRHTGTTVIQPVTQNQPEPGDSPAAEEGQAEEQVPEPLPEDERVRPAFVNDLASWVVGRYQPGSQGGTLAVSVQSLNQRYGTGMTGLLSPRGLDARSSILRYAFTPSMIRGLYQVYADSFLRSLAEQAQSERKNLTRDELAGLYRTMGSRCVLLAGGLESVASLPDLSGRLHAIDQAEQYEIEANRRLLDARFDLEQAREGNPGSIGLSQAEAQMEAAARGLQAASEVVRSERRHLAEDIRRKGSSALNDETLLYLARWVGRRLEENAGALESTRAAAEVLRDLAQRCAKASREGAPALPGQTPAGQAGTGAAPAAQTPTQAPVQAPAQTPGAQGRAVPARMAPEEAANSTNPQLPAHIFLPQNPSPMVGGAVTVPGRTQTKTHE